MRPATHQLTETLLEKMLKLSNPVALRAFEKALTKVRAGPRPRPKFSSRTADKFVIRGYVELFEELKGIGLHQGRSMNSEAVAAILDSLEGNLRSTARVRVLQAHLGRRLSAEVMAEVGVFDLTVCAKPQKFVVRLPPSVRDVIRDGVKKVTTGEGGKISMRDWVLEALVKWVNSQRQEFALLTTIIEVDKSLLEQF